MINKEKYQKMNKNDLNKELLKESELGSLSIIKFLLTSKDLKVHANPNYKDEQGMTALMISCRNDSLDIIRYLLTSPNLKTHADINHKNKYGWNVLTYACFNDYTNINEFLILDMNMNVDEDTLRWLRGGNKQNRVYDNIFKLIEYRDLSMKLNNKITNENTRNVKI